jgi:hypothetical protein
VRHALARALATAGLGADDVAARLGVDPKTVQRWYAGRVPYPRYRTALAELTGWPAHDLWPEAARPATPHASPDELLVMYGTRSAVPSDAWRRLFARAEREIGIVVYSGLFLAEDAGVHRVLRDKARAGVPLRIALGDPDSPRVAERGHDEGIDGVMVARIRNAMILYRSLATVPGVEIRIHDTVLYDSIYQADDELLVNAHLYGRPASQAPVLHLRRASEDGMAAGYLAAFTRVWAAARPVTP